MLLSTRSQSIIHSLARFLDPRRSLASAIGWLVFALSTGLVLVANVWIDGMVQTSLLDQRERQLERSADRIAAELNLDLERRLQSMRALAAMLATEIREENQGTLRRILENLQRASPEFEWIGVADPHGRLVAATHGMPEGASVADRSWLAPDPPGAAVGDVRVAPAATQGVPGSFVDMVAPVTDAKGGRVGVIRARLKGRWQRDLAESLVHEDAASTGTESLLLDSEGTVLHGPAALQGKRWVSTAATPDGAGARAGVIGQADGAAARPGVEELADGSRYLVARAKPAATDAWRALGWRVVVTQPLRDATRRAGTLQGQIAAVLSGLGLVASLLGVLLARRLTRGLDAIARSADAVRTGASQEIAVPAGRNEAALLGHALRDLLTSLQSERGALQTLNAELDQRVAARTREIERLAEQGRHAAVARERLRIARDLHDTLAHSMMAMLTQVRLLKRLSATSPGALTEELARAEEAAHQGLREARAAIAQMRFNPVRDVGLGAALGDFVKLFVERTGIPVDYTIDAPAGTFADERAETLFRIAEEAMRNIERHAGATRVEVSLRGPLDGRGWTLTIADNGVGFDSQAPHPGHYGVAGLREQAHTIGAGLGIDSGPQGTTVRVALPGPPGLDS